MQLLNPPRLQLPIENKIKHLFIILFEYLKSVLNIIKKLTMLRDLHVKKFMETHVNTKKYT